VNEQKEEKEKNYFGEDGESELGEIRERGLNTNIKTYRFIRENNQQACDQWGVQNGRWRKARVECRN